MLMPHVMQRRGENSNVYIVTSSIIQFLRPCFAVIDIGRKLYREILKNEKMYTANGKEKLGICICRNKLFVTLRKILKT